ncbi:hypothetical protein GCM10023215_45030 [Pseudonocardia yuanmonensis]|uniref:Uncharacterized protein n=1 Tax=Pseudonocardia yuanmonensis TaxID=1095914 RepID=A0ABP8X657_9PSEU
MRSIYQGDGRPDAPLREVLRVQNTVDLLVPWSEWPGSGVPRTATVTITTVQAKRKTGLQAILRVLVK